MKDEMKLAQQLSRMEGSMIAGFEAINQRLDCSNGRLAKHDEIIADLCERNSFVDGERKGIKISWGILITALTVALGILTVIFVKK